MMRRSLFFSGLFIVLINAFNVSRVSGGTAGGEVSFFKPSEIRNPAGLYKTWEKEAKGDKKSLSAHLFDLSKKIKSCHDGPSEKFQALPSCISDTFNRSISEIVKGYGKFADNSSSQYFSDSLEQNKSNLKHEIRNSIKTKYNSYLAPPSPSPSGNPGSGAGQGKANTASASGKGWLGAAPGPKIAIFSLIILLAVVYTIVRRYNKAKTTTSTSLNDKEKQSSIDPIQPYLLTRNDLRPLDPSIRPQRLELIQERLNLFPPFLPLADTKWLIGATNNPNFEADARLGLIGRISELFDLINIWKNEEGSVEEGLTLVEKDKLISIFNQLIQKSLFWDNIDRCEEWIRKNELLRKFTKTSQPETGMYLWNRLLMEAMLPDILIPSPKTHEAFKQLMGNRNLPSSDYQTGKGVILDAFPQQRPGGQTDSKGYEAALSPRNASTEEGNDKSERKFSDHVRVSISIDDRDTIDKPFLYIEHENIYVDVEQPSEEDDREQFQDDPKICWDFSPHRSAENGEERRVESLKGYQVEMIIKSGTFEMSFSRTALVGHGRVDTILSPSPNVRHQPYKNPVSQPAKSVPLNNPSGGNTSSPQGVTRQNQFYDAPGKSGDNESQTRITGLGLDESVVQPEQHGASGNPNSSTAQSEPLIEVQRSLLDSPPSIHSLYDQSVELYQKVETEGWGREDLWAIDRLKHLAIFLRTYPEFDGLPKGDWTEVLDLLGRHVFNPEQDDFMEASKDAAREALVQKAKNLRESMKKYVKDIWQLNMISLRGVYDPLRHEQRDEEWTDDLNKHLKIADHYRIGFERPQSLGGVIRKTEVKVFRYHSELGFNDTNGIGDQPFYPSSESQAIQGQAETTPSGSDKVSQGMNEVQTNLLQKVEEHIDELKTRTEGLELADVQSLAAAVTVFFSTLGEEARQTQREAMQERLKELHLNLIDPEMGKDRYAESPSKGGYEYSPGYEFEPLDGDGICVKVLRVGLKMTEGKELHVVPRIKVASK